MNNIQLENIILKNDCLKKYVKGVYACNTLPENVTNFPSAFIVNTDPIPKPGKHWVAIVMHSSSQIDYFDSLGQPPAKNNDISLFLQRYGCHVNFSRKKIQSDESDLCGLYVLCFLYLRLCCKIVFFDVFKYFTDDVLMNETFVYKFVQNFLK